MALDMSGATLGTIIAQALGVPEPPVNPTPEQEATYQAVLAAQTANWTIISQCILSYIAANATVSTTNTVPANGIVAPVSGGPCTGASIGSTGTGKIS